MCVDSFSSGSNILPIGVPAFQSASVNDTHGVREVNRKIMHSDGLCPARNPAVRFQPASICGYGANRGQWSPHTAVNMPWIKVDHTIRRSEPDPAFEINLSRIPQTGRGVGAATLPLETLEPLSCGTGRTCRPRFPAGECVRLPAYHWSKDLHRDLPRAQ